VALVQPSSNVATRRNNADYVEPINLETAVVCHGWLSLTNDWFRPQPPVCSALLVTPLFNALGINDRRARGFAAGLAAHGIGTARAFQVSDVAGVFAGIAMALNGLITAFLVPLLAKLL
jgi:hypothetical protein